MLILGYCHVMSFFDVNPGIKKRTKKKNEKSRIRLTKKYS